MRSRPKTSPRSRATKGIPVEVIPDVEHAIQRAIALATDDDVILVTGSFYVIGTARRVLLRDGGVDLRRSLPCPAMDRTFVICKPDSVERGLVGEILGRFERKGLRIVAARAADARSRTLGRHYEEHVGKGFYDDLVAFMSRGPAVVLVLEGPQDTYKVVRTLMGATNPRDADPGTIRGDLGIELTENLVHGSDSQESAAREIGIFFPSL